jgi:methylmalonyl-CoA mutase cobalamin-binding subunit
MNERLKRIIFKKLDQDLGQAEIIVDDNKSIWFIDRANKFWYLELRSSGTLWWRYSFFRDFFPLFGMERLEYEPVIAEWVEEVLKRGVSSTYIEGDNLEVLVEEVLKRGVSSTLQSKIDYQNQVEEVLKREVSSTLHREFPLMDGGVEEALKRGVSSTQRNHMNDCDEMEEALKRGVYSTQCNVGLQGSRPVEEILKPKASPTTVDNLSAVVTMKKVLSLKAGVRECKMKMKKIFKKIII